MQHDTRAQSEDEHGTHHVILVDVVDPDPLAAAGIRSILERVPGIEVIPEPAQTEQVGGRATELHPHVTLLTVAEHSRVALSAIERLRVAGTAVLTLTLGEDDRLLLATLEAGASGNREKSASPDDLIRAVRLLAEGLPALSDRQSQLLLNEWVRDQCDPERAEARRAAALLTLREREVARAVTRGLTNSQIAAELHCAPTTVKTHLGAVFLRLGVTNRVGVAILGLRAGLLDDD